MVAIIKTSTVAEGGLLFVTETTYQDPQVYVGSLAYIWTSETSGGEGLFCRGIIEEVTYVEDRTLRLRVRLVGGAPYRPLNKAVLEPLRNEAGDDPSVLLARKLYRHAHNKVASLSPEEVIYVDRFFEAT